jgi:hypothetical protein
LAGSCRAALAVILKIIWQKDLRIIAPLLLPCGRRLGVSAKRSMSGHHPRNVRESRAEDIKRTKMIAGQESGSARHAGRTGAGFAA